MKGDGFTVVVGVVVVDDVCVELLMGLNLAEDEVVEDVNCLLVIVARMGENGDGVVVDDVDVHEDVLVADVDIVVGLIEE